MAGERFNVVQSEHGGLGDGVEERRVIEAPRLAAEPPTQLLGIRRPLASGVRA